MRVDEPFAVSYISGGKNMTVRFSDVQLALKFGFAVEDHGHSVKVIDILHELDIYASVQ